MPTQSPCFRPSPASSTSTRAPGHQTLASFAALCPLCLMRCVSLFSSWGCYHASFPSTRPISHSFLSLPQAPAGMLSSYPVPPKRNGGLDIEHTFKSKSTRANEFSREYSINEGRTLMIFDVITGEKLLDHESYVEKQVVRKSKKKTHQAPVQERAFPAAVPRQVHRQASKPRELQAIDEDRVATVVAHERAASPPQLPTDPTSGSVQPTPAQTEKVWFSAVRCSNLWCHVTSLQHRCCFVWLWIWFSFFIFSRSSGATHHRA